MDRALLLTALASCGLAGCGAGDSDAPRTAEPAGAEDVRLKPTPASERASRSRLEPSVAPHTGTRTSVVRVTFRSRVRLGATRDGRTRSYYVVAKRRPAMSGCVQHRYGWVGSGRRGRRVTARMDPTRGKGGHLGWCRGRYRGRIRYFDGYACPSEGECRAPRGFERIYRRVGTFRFAIE